MSHYYKLEEKTPVAVESIVEWANWMAHAQTRIMYNEFNGCAVSTVFTGVDVGVNPWCSEPKLFETLVVGGALHGRRNHYTTYDEAIAGHLEMCVLVFKTCHP